MTPSLNIDAQGSREAWSARRVVAPAGRVHGEWAYYDRVLTDAAKVGILAGSLTAGVLGYAVLRSGAPGDQGAEAEPASPAGGTGDVGTTPADDVTYVAPDGRLTR